ncbi:hypothetical protein DPMN_014026 [Dreissena polymorpha]|uniref:Uncharacterized protein n=1 Tax=Dreissena polymorpha TaxID=45954 RepID=A0A9D4NA02_DREPO|nr:hypothetical protein DPMN_014026 [Dreissena polymorpha]
MATCLTKSSRVATLLKCHVAACLSAATRFLTTASSNAGKCSSKTSGLWYLYACLFRYPVGPAHPGTTHGTNTLRVLRFIAPELAATADDFAGTSSSLLRFPRIVTIKSPT